MKPWNINSCFCVRSVHLGWGFPSFTEGLHWENSTFQIRVLDFLVCLLVTTQGAAGEPKAWEQQLMQKILVFDGFLVLWNQLLISQDDLKGSHLMSDHSICKVNKLQVLLK